jgi:hypothetical protein
LPRGDKYPAEDATSLEATVASRMDSFSFDGDVLVFGSFSFRGVVLDLPVARRSCRTSPFMSLNDLWASAASLLASSSTELHSPLPGTFFVQSFALVLDDNRF